jgi:hypothetical protein
MIFTNNQRRFPDGLKTVVGGGSGVVTQMWNITEYS